MSFIETSDNTQLFYEDWGTGQPLMVRTRYLKPTLEMNCNNASLWVMPFNSISPSSTTEREAAPLTETKKYGEFNPVFSPDGQQIAFSSNKANIQKFKNKEDVDDTD